MPEVIDMPDIKMLASKFIQTLKERIEGIVLVQQALNADIGIFGLHKHHAMNLPAASGRGILRGRLKYT